MSRHCAELLRRLQAVGCGLKVENPIRVTLIVLAVALFACSSSPPKEKATPPPTKQETVEVAPPEPVGPPPIPPEATQRFENALTLLSAGDYARAEPELKRLAETYPEYSGALANLGILYLKTNKLADAEKALKAATTRGPENAFAFNQLGIVYRKLGRFKEADAAYSKALAIDPNYALAHLNLGVLCDLYLQQPERALAAFERYSALTTKPDARVAGWMKELKGRVKPQQAPSGSTQ
jgi:predicted Zn-dependent protease